MKEFLIALGVGVFIALLAKSLCKRTPTDLDNIEALDWREMRRRYRADDGWWL
jgi:hypothetical protein